MGRDLRTLVVDSTQTGRHGDSAANSYQHRRSSESLSDSLAVYRYDEPSCQMGEQLCSRGRQCGFSLQDWFSESTWLAGILVERYVIRETRRISTPGRILRLGLFQ